MKEQIADYFAGIVTHDISEAEQLEHNRLVKDVRKVTRYMIRYQAQKIQKQLKFANCKFISYNAFKQK